MSAGNTLVSVLTEHAAARAQRAALVYSVDPTDSGSNRTLSFKELDWAARRLAAWLLERYRPGARAVLMYPPGLEFGVAFAGCAYAGLVAVPVPTPDGTPQRDARAAGIVSDAGAAVVLTEASTLEGTVAWRDATGLTGVDCAATDRIGSGFDGWAPGPPDPAVPLMLQYTSGSTTEPRGVVISHANLMAQVAMSRRVMSVHADTLFGGWLPMHHDLGLIVQLLQPFVLGATSVFMSPFEFLKRPYRWLELIDRNRVEVSLAPNFAYDLCRRQVGADRVAQLDLSGWQVAGIGAETVRGDTVAGFAERFAPAGFHRTALTVGYGLAEAMVYVSVGLREAEPVLCPVDTDRLERNEFVPVEPGPAASTLVSCGYPCEMELRVVDPMTARPLPDGQIGEIWLRGPGVAEGYWNAEDATRRTFGGTTATGDTGYLRTGDLGAVHAGQVYVTGRIKDLLIVRGRNLHPQDIEHEIRLAHESLALRHGAVFAVHAGGAEHVVLVHECAVELAGDEAALAALAVLLHDTVTQRFGVALGGVVLVKPGGVTRTASGKVERARMRERFLARGLRPLHENLNPALRRALQTPIPAGAN